MDPKRKRIYLGVIIVCMIGIVVVILWGNSLLSFSGSAPTTTTTTSVTTAPNVTVKQNTDGTYNPPAVFPANSKIDTSVLDSSQFKSLNAYQPVTVSSGELGRDDPFVKFK